MASMKRLTSTEIIIDKALKFLDTDPWDDLGEWPADAHIHKGMRLSESKMLNEIDEREPRTSNYDGHASAYGLFGTNTGWHTTTIRNRKSDIEDLGEGTVLYFKFLKYMITLFFFCALFSGPIITVYLYGMGYDHIKDPIQKIAAFSTMGNLQANKDLSCSAAQLPETYNSASYISFKCDKGKKITNLTHFGLAYKNETCTGHGLDKKVNTIERCSFGI
jgi:hypothetical protein